jgi:uncharacterized protein YqjF (DUF2071 family)
VYLVDRKGRLFESEVDHDPWEFQDAFVEVKRNSITEGWGIEIDLQPPIVQYSDSLKVIAWSKRPLSSV